MKRCPQCPECDHEYDNTMICLDDGTGTALRRGALNRSCWSLVDSHRAIALNIRVSSTVTMGLAILGIVAGISILIRR